MKKLSKIMLSLLAVFAVVVMFKIPAKASTSEFWQSDCSTKSATVSWDLSNRVSQGYTITSCYLSTSSSSDQTDSTQILKDLKSSISGSYQLTLPSGTNEIIYLHYDCTMNGNGYHGWYSTYVNTRPAKPSKSNFGIYSLNNSSCKLTFAVSKTANDMDGAQIEVYKGSKKSYSGKFTTYSNQVNVSKNSVYKYRVRYYCVNDATNTTYYGSWSDYRYFDFGSMSAKSSSKKKGITLTLKKVSGVSSYKIYIKTSSSGSYKYVKSVKPGKKSTFTTQITSKYKKKKTNYIKVIPVISGHGNSDVFMTGSIYTYK